MQHPVTGAAGSACAVSAAAGQQPELYAEDQNQEQREPEFGNTANHRSRFADDPVGPPVLKPGAQYSEKKRQSKDENKTRSSQNQRISQPASDDLQHVGFIFKRNAEIPLQSAGQPVFVLNNEGIV